MLKTIKNLRSAANPEKTKSEIGDNSVVSDSIVGGNEATNQANSTKGKNQAKITKSKF